MTINKMMREQIKKDIARAVSSFQFPVSSLEIEVTRTSDPRFGDFATNVGLKAVHLGGGKTSHPRGDIKHSPMEFAKILADSLEDLPYVEKLEVKEPGFLNFFIKDEIWQKQVEDVLNRGSKYGANEIAKGQKARVEFVSANQTGPLHFGNARGGPIGDSLASVLEFCGYKVLREYYHNDVGEQVGKLGQSILNVSAGKSLEDQEYKGEYIKEFADEISAQIIDKTRPTGITSPSLDWDTFGKKAVDKLLSEILADCKAMGIKFNEVYSESEFIKSGQTKKALEKIKKFIKKKNGADWFAPSDEFLKDRETVVKKSDGSYTYFANDIAYHRLKFQEGYDLVIDILGANHHGHVPRLKGAVSALGYDPSKFHVILYQWVRFKRGGKSVAMSKRSGTFITAEEMLREVGRDAVRFFILMHDANSHIDFDLDLARKKSKENPVYYVQYANARICSILTKAKRQTTNAKIDYPLPTTHYQLLTTNYELDLIKQITRLPELVEDIGQSFAVHRLTTYAIELADSFHKFYENCQVLGTGGDLESARLSLILATKIALFNTLKLLGVSAPEKM